MKREKSVRRVAVSDIVVPDRLRARGNGREHERGPLEIRLFDQLTIARGGEPVELPASRKVRALIAYLVLARAPVTRTRLCELLWDAPNDPRGSLRWALSKIRRAFGDDERVQARGDLISLDLTDCRVDALDIEIADADDAVSPETARALVDGIGGQFLEGLELDDGVAFNAWLVAERRRFHECHVRLLRAVVDAYGDDAGLPYIEKWLALEPFDESVHERLLRALYQRDRYHEAEEHASVASRLYDAEGLDGRRILDAAEGLRSQAGRRDEEPRRSTRASVAVLPFAPLASADAGESETLDALVHDIISKLAKLRSIATIGQGSVFALRDRGVDAAEAARLLDVEYVVTGFARRDSSGVALTVELTESLTGRIVWTEEFDYARDRTFEAIDEIGGRIAAFLIGEIEANERNRAILLPPGSLDAWQAFHRGAWHMYRFRPEHNAQSQQFFEMAARLDPTFARAHAGLSFTHFQNAFQRWGDVESESRLALESARNAVLIDARDPSGHWAMGRALYLRGDTEQAVVELGQSLALSPSYACAHYFLAFVYAQSGEPNHALPPCDRAERLSPFDPLIFGVMTARAMAYARLEKFDEAAKWALKAVSYPNAPVKVHALAALTLSLAGRNDEARAELGTLRSMQSNYGLDDFLTATRFDKHGERLFRHAANRLSLSS